MKNIQSSTKTNKKVRSLFWEKEREEILLKKLSANAVKKIQHKRGSYFKYSVSIYARYIPKGGPMWWKMWQIWPQGGDISVMHYFSYVLYRGILKNVDSQCDKKITKK